MLLLFCVLFVPAYLACWLLFSLLTPLLNETLGGIAQLYFSATGRGIDFFGEQSGIVIRSFTAPAFEAEIVTRPILSNTPLLWTLMVITPGMLLKRRLSRLSIAGLILLLIQGVFLFTKVEVTLIETGHPWAGSPGFWRGLDDLFEISGKGFPPFGIWFALTLPYLLGKFDRRPVREEGKVGRNSPCPCGSGRKFKRCCGRGN